MKRNISPWLILVFVAVIWRLIYAYWTPAIGHYVVPPGDDGAVHIQTINEFLHGHLTLIGPNSYPHGFHIMMAVVAKIFGLSALAAVVWITPLLIVIPIVVVYYVGKHFFHSALAGAVAAAAWAFMALAPVRALGDGNYPNLFAASVLMPLALLALYRYVIAPKMFKIIAVVVLTVLIAFMHHLTLVYLVAISIPWLLVMTFEKLWDIHRHKKALRIVLASLFAITLVVTLFILLYGKLLLPYLAIANQGGSLSQYLGGDSSTLSLMQVLEINGPLLVLLGLVGLLALMTSAQERYIKLFFASWVLMLLALGSVSIVGLPGRFVRELAVPFSLLIGFLFQFLYDHTTPRLRNVLIPSVVVMLLGEVWFSGFNRPFALPDPYKPIMRVQHEEEIAFVQLDNLTPTGNTILANNTNPFLPFLVHHTVQVPFVPTDVVEIIRNPQVTTIYIATAPPLTADYPFYVHNGEISAALASIPQLKLRYTLSNGSKIYTRDTTPIVK